MDFLIRIFGFYAIQIKFSMQSSGGSGLPRYAVQYAAEKAGNRRRTAATAARAAAMEARSAGNKMLAAEKQGVAAAETARTAREAAPARLQLLVRALLCSSSASCPPILRYLPSSRALPVRPYSDIVLCSLHTIAAPPRLHFSPSVGIPTWHTTMCCLHAVLVCRGFPHKHYEPVDHSDCAR